MMIKIFVKAGQRKKKAIEQNRTGKKKSKAKYIIT